MISPGFFWPAAFLALLVPPIMAIEVIRLVYLIYRRSKFAIFPLGLLLLGYPFIKATFPIFQDKETLDTDFSVLSYNARIFNLYENKPVLSEEMIKWSIAQSADIKCFQEYYNLDNDLIYSTTKRLSHQGEWYHFVQPAVVNRIGAEFGLAIFSKYPIVARGMIDIKKRSTNSAIFADIAIGSDTVRVINIHLQSIGFNNDDFTINPQEKMDGVKNIIDKLKVGFIGRDKQLKKLEVYLENSKYPVIICGDLNDTPYSYAYFKFRRHLKNAFEEKGSGLGFSYDGALSFLRIDHQFFSEGLDICNFITKKDTQFSDHYPILAGYKIKKQP